MKPFTAENLQFSRSIINYLKRDIMFGSDWWVMCPVDYAGKHGDSTAVVLPVTVQVIIRPNRMNFLSQYCITRHLHAYVYMVRVVGPKFYYRYKQNELTR